jgi:glycosyltransferase involved in cell wall biosynthesis
MAIGISVLIRTYNSERTLDLLLSKLDLCEGDEILIVDSGSTDRTRNIASQFGAAIIEAPLPFNYSTSLNAGFSHARNPLVLVLSSHSIPQVPNLLSLFRNAAARSPLDVVVFYAPSTMSGRSDAAFPADHISYFSEKDYPYTSAVCGNGNALYRRSGWEELIFDESKITAEDKIWITEMIRRGFHYAYLPTARTINKNQASLLYMYRKGYRDARAQRAPDHKPMSLYQLAGALKGMVRRLFFEGIGWGNFVRYTAHNLGQFTASYRPPANEREGHSDPS